MASNIVTEQTEWVECSQSLPPDGEIVETKIDDGRKCRNECRLKRQGRLWFFEDESMYVYYTPTHWRRLNAKENAEIRQRAALIESALKKLTADEIAALQPRATP